MELIVTTPPTGTVISLNSVKDHLRIERDEADYDDDLNELIEAARRYIEEETHVTLLQTEFEARWNGFPCGVLKIPGYPMVSVDSVEYIDTDGATQPLTDYQASLIQTPAFIRPAAETAWPETQADTLETVTVKFTAGYATEAAIPQEYKHMLKLLVAHWFRNREAIGTTNQKELQLAFTSLRNIGWRNEFEAYV